MVAAKSNTMNIEVALIQAAVQLSAPTVSSVDAVPGHARSHSISKEPSTTRKIRHRLLSLSFSSAKHSNLNKRTAVRDLAAQSSSTKSDTCESLHQSNSNRQNMTTTTTTMSTEYLLSRHYKPHPTPTNHSPTKRHEPAKPALLSIWQGLNTNEVPKSPSSPTSVTRTNERMNKNTREWKHFSNAVAALLTSQRTKKERYQWTQLVGHNGTFKQGTQIGYILKALCPNEQQCYDLLRQDILRDFVPKYNGTVVDNEGNSFIEMEDLLISFDEPSVMDCKIGVRTYLEEELDKSEHNPEPRADLYNKMIAIDASAPTDQEHTDKKILKSRYMIWRERTSSSHKLGFRVEAIKKFSDATTKKYQNLNEYNDVKEQINEFLAYSLPRATQYLERLKALRFACTHSTFFQTHELIGSSILFVHDDDKASLWMIDFGKTRPLPDGIHIKHDRSWHRGSHEDGYLVGLDSLISILCEIVCELKSNSTSEGWLCDSNHADLEFYTKIQHEDERKGLLASRRNTGRQKSTKHKTTRLGRRYLFEEKSSLRPTYW